MLTMSCKMMPVHCMGSILLLCLKYASCESLLAPDDKVPAKASTLPFSLSRPQTKLSEILIDSFRDGHHQQSFTERSLQSDGSINYDPSMCSMCQGSEILEDRTPIYEASEETPPNITCGEFENFAQSSITIDDCTLSGLANLYPQCCIGSVPRYTCEKTIRSGILNSDNYDAAVPPITSPASPLYVYMDVRYQTVEKLDVQGGTGSIFLTIDLIWNDPRLAWNITEETCADSVTAWASMDREKTEMWVPDLDLYNQVQGVQGLPDTMATIYNDGTVYWNRNGGLDVICQFVGLAKIPFDTLGCQMLFGPWVRMDERQVKYEPIGFGNGNFPPTYNEFRPVPDLFEFGTAFGGNFVYYDFYFQRAKKYYVFNLVIPTIILTYVSFGTFLLDLRVGERLSYGMALALVVVAQQIVTGDLVPVSDEWLWIDKFIGWSFYWVIVGLVQSVCMGYIFFLREDRSTKNSNRRNKINPKQNYQIYDGGISTRKEPLDAVPEKSDYQEDTASSGWIDSRSSTSSLAKQETNGGDDLNAHSGENARSRKREVEARTLKLKMRHKEQWPVSSMEKEEIGDTEKDELEDVHHPRFPWMYTISLRKVDHFFFCLTITTYTVYLIVMFATIPKWGQNIVIPFVNEDSPIPDTLQ